MKDVINKQLLKGISAGAFLHDVGKFAERAGAIEMGDEDMVKQEYRYAHAHHTELALKSLFVVEQLEKKIAEDSEHTVLNMASRHHKPRNIYEHIIAQADQISSGHERSAGDDESDYDTGGRERKRQTPLLTILSRIQLKNAPAPPEGDWRYRISQAGTAGSSTGYEKFFPVSKEKYTYKEVEQDYVTQWKGFSKAIRPSMDPGLDLFDHFSTVFAVSREFQWCLPASTRKQELPDVSLFDHQKVTAALAACLYSYHAGNNTLVEQKLFDRKTDKFLLFCGDISGIQKFIYQISSKGAYRTLKGKSFYIQLLAEVLAQEFIDLFDLTVTNILYASGGKFYLMLPNLPEVVEKLGVLLDSINGELLEQFNGDLFLRSGYKKLSANDLTRKSGKTLYQTWDQLTRQLVYQDRQRYCTTATDNYVQLFEIKADDELGSCEVCHKTTRKLEQKICTSCRDLSEMGRQLGTTVWIAVGNGKHDIQGKNKPFPIRNKFVWLLDKEPREIYGKGVVLHGINARDFYRPALDIRGGTPVNSVPMATGSSHRFDVTFDEIAQRARSGFKRLGIVRMDVDNLGKVFSEGLENYKHGFLEETDRFHSLGRITTLSWQLSQFFGPVLPAMIADNPDWCDTVTVVYSGGDDLFLLGAWDVLPEVVLKIKKQFTDFCCHNSSFSLSGGMVITGGNFPIYKSADMAGEAEALAKHNTTIFRGEKKKRKKNSFTFFDTAMHWQEFEEIAVLQEKLHTLLLQPGNYPLLQRLRDIALSWQQSREQMERSRPSCTLSEIHTLIQAEKWRWRMVYALHRFSGNREKDMKAEVEKLQKFIVEYVADTDRTGIELLGILSRWSELRLR